jgi:hypothetical protein
VRFALLGSSGEDGAAWDTLLSVEDVAWHDGSEWKHWTIEASRAYRSFVLVLVASANPELLVLQRAWLAPR